MARPNKDGLDYFPFDVDMFDDEKVVAVSGEFGIKGEITLIKLLCAIYRNGYFVLWNDLMKYKLLKSLPGISSELIENIVLRLVKWNFFDEGLFNSEHILTSTAIQARYFEAAKRRKKNDKLPYILVNVYNNPVNVCDNSVNVDIYRQRKVKESKVKKTKEVEREKTTTPTSTSSSDILSSEIKQLKTSRDWKLLVCKRFNISSINLDAVIEQFETDCRLGGKTSHSNIQDCMAHFCSYLRKHDTSPNSNSAKTADIYAHTSTTKKPDRKEMLIGYIRLLNKDPDSFVREVLKKAYASGELIKLGIEWHP